MPYRLVFDEQALQEWKSLQENVRKQFRDKMLERRENPEVPKDRLSGEPGCYKLKIMTPPLRLVYEVRHKPDLVKVWGIGPRADKAAYKAAFARLKAKAPKR
jgi:mRNA interferase RelE/StbE